MEWSRVAGSEGMSIPILRLSAALLTLAACTSGGGDGDAAQQLRVARDPAAMLRIAGAAERAGDPASAAAFYQRAADLKPASAAATLGVAQSLAEQGRTEESVDQLFSAHAQRPADTLVSATLGRMLVVAHRPRDALTAFQDGLRIDPRSTSLLTGQGVALDALEQHAAAQDSYRAALSITPGSVPATNNLALSLALSGHADQAAAMLQPLHLSADAADRATVSGNLALAYGLQGDMASAAALARQAMPEQDVDANLTFYATLRDQRAAGAGAAGTGAAGIAGKALNGATAVSPTGATPP